MTTTIETIRNGVDTRADVRDARRDQGRSPSSARSSSAPRNHWIDGAHNRTTIQDFYGAGQEDTSRAEPFVVDAGEPAVLLGTDTGANPAEHLLHALAACLTTSLVYVAAARKVAPDRGRVDARGRHGRARRARPLRRGTATASTQIRVSFRSRATRRRRSCARSSSAPRRARPSSTWSPTASRSRSTWPTRRGAGHGRSQPATASRATARPSGARLVAPRRDARRRVRRRAPPQHDREASYPFASVDALTARGLLRRADPGRATAASASRRCTTCSSPSSRLARGDASVAIGVNMHLAVRAEHRAPLADGRRGRRRAPRRGVRRVAGARSPATASSSPRRSASCGQDLTRPAHDGDAHRRAAGGSTAARSFCTMSPAATVLYTAVTFADDDGVERYGYAPVPADARRRRRSTATGTRSACAPRAATRSRFDGVELPRGRAARRLPRRRRGWRTWSATSPPACSTPPASLGIAESAHGRLRMLARAAASRDARTRMLVAENAIDLGACRAHALARALIDALRRRPPTDGRRGVALFAEAQAAKAFVNEAARARSSTARSRCRAAPATSTATRSPAPTATSAPARSCTRSAPTAPTSSRAASPSGSTRA